MHRGIERGIGGAPSAPRAAGRADAEPLMTWVGALAVALVEMAQGMRPVTALDGVATPAARRRIQRVVRDAMRARGRRRARVSPVRLVAVRGMQPTAGALEAAVTVAVGRRAVAVAARVEHDGTTWRLVELVPPGTGLLPAGWRAGSRAG